MESATPAQRRGRERRRERGGRRAASPSPRAYRVREVHRPRAASPSTHRGRERRLERCGARDAIPSPRRGRERRWERDGPRGDSPRTRPGCERPLERGGASVATPSPRRGRERHQERDGPRDASPSTRRGRERFSENYMSRYTSPTTRRGRHRRRERDAPRTISTAPHQRSVRRAERDGPRGAEPTTFLDQEQHSGAWLTTHRFHARSPTAPPSSHRGKDGPPENFVPRSTSPISDRGRAFQEEGEGSQPRSSIYHGQKRRRQDYDGSAPPTSHSGESLATSPTPPAAQIRSVDEENIRDKNDRDASAMIILNAGDDLLGEIIVRLHPTEITRMVCGQHIHRVISRMINPLLPQLLSPFLGALVQRGKSHNIVTLFNTRLMREIRSSVAYLRGSLKQLTHNTDIIDCRQGLMALCFGKEEKNFCICNPFLRKTWILLPQFGVQTDQVIGGVLIAQSSFDFSLLLLCLDKSAQGFQYPLVVKIFQSNTRKWERIAMSLHLKEGDIVQQHGIYCKDAVYFLCKKRKIILKVDPAQLTIDVIPLPRDSSQMVLTRVGQQLCFAIAKNRQILVFLYNNNQWVHRWSRQTPSEGYWTKLIGSAEENGIIIVETGEEQAHALKVENGSWIRLQQESMGQWCIGIEISSSFRYPFTQPMFHLEEAMPECIRYGMLKEIQ